MKRLLVIGGGLAGLSAAWHAQRAGAQVRVLELGSHPGGVVQSHRENGFLVESGPNTLLANSPALMKLLGQLKLESEIVETAPAARERFIVRGGKLVPVPLTPGRFLTSPLLGLPAKLRLLGEPLAAARPKNTPGEESLADFARRRLGAEAFAYGLEPFVAGIFAGDPEKLAARYTVPRLHAMEAEHGSLAMAALSKLRQKSGTGPPRLISFHDGMATLSRTLAAQLGGSLSLGTLLLSLDRTPAGEWEAQWPSARERFDGVVLAVPAHALAQLPVPASLVAQLAPLKKIDYPPVTIVFLGYLRHQITHPLDGFGLLAPALESLHVLGVLFTSTLFPGRAPAGHAALTAFVGGARSPETALLPDDALVNTVTGDLQKLLGVAGAPVFRKIIRWPHAIPQYNLDHADMLEAVEAAEQAWPGLALAGSYYGGVSVANCLETGRAAAGRALKLSPTGAE